MERGIKLVKTDTLEQLGDIFTKDLPKTTFEYLRKNLMGWELSPVHYFHCF